MAKDSYERCLLCGLGRHRYMFPADADAHEPSGVACANTILAEIDLMLAKVDPDAKAHVRERIDNAITLLGAAVTDKAFRKRILDHA